MKLFYNKIGSGPALLILHGLYGSGDNWFNIGKALSEHFTVYLIDQRNHGKSPHSPSHNYNDMSSDLEELIANENLRDIYIIGHSMGGKTAMSYTLTHGENVNKLVNVDISPYSYLGMDHFTDQYKLHQTIIDRFASTPLHSISSRKEVEDYFEEKIKNNNIRRFLLKNLKREKEGAFGWRLNVSALANNIEHVVDATPPIKIGAQTYTECLFIRGGMAPYISDEDIESIPDIFPNSKFLTYDNSGHWLHAEEPERFIKDVKDFLL
jgi:pimeloyl-ACP methyl ester carboxylesterase